MFLSVSFRLLLLLDCMCLLRHQVRRARATHIDSLLIPRTYATSYLMTFLAAARREFGPLIVAVAFLSYFPTPLSQGALLQLPVVRYLQCMN